MRPDPGTRLRPKWRGSAGQQQEDPTGAIQRPEKCALTCCSGSSRDRCEAVRGDDPQILAEARERYDCCC